MLNSRNARRSAALAVGASASLLLAVTANGAMAAPAPTTNASCPATPGVTPNSINVGWVGSKTGPAATTFIGASEGAQLRFDQENAKGGVNGYKIVSFPGAGVPQTPLQQTVELVPGGWLANYKSYPILWVIPLLGFAGLLLGWLSVRGNKHTLAWWLGAVSWIGVIGTIGVAMFPFLMPSSSNPSQSLTLWNAISSETTLLWMTGWTVVFVPIIFWYTSWAFYVMRGKVDPKEVEVDPHAY